MLLGVPYSSWFSGWYFKEKDKSNDLPGIAVFSSRNFFILLINHLNDLTLFSIAYIDKLCILKYRLQIGMETQDHG